MRCSITNKIIFTKRKAQEALNWSDKQRRDKKAKRIYHCEECNGWHLTSNPDINELHRENGHRGWINIKES